MRQPTLPHRQSTLLTTKDDRERARARTRRACRSERFGEPEFRRVTEGARYSFSSSRLCPLEIGQCPLVALFFPYRKRCKGSDTTRSPNRPAKPAFCALLPLQAHHRKTRIRARVEEAIGQLRQTCRITGIAFSVDLDHEEAEDAARAGGSMLGRYSLRCALPFAPSGRAYIFPRIFCYPR